MRDALLRLGRRVVVAALERSIAVVEVALVVLGAPPLVVVSPPPKEPHDADPADVDPVPDVPSCTERGLHRSEEGRADDGGQLSAAASSSAQGRDEGQPAAGPVDLLPPIVDRDIKPENVPVSKYRCGKCGFVGGNARGCGTSHETISDDDGKPGSGQSEPHETQQGASTPGQRARAAAGNVADSHGAPIGHRSAGPSSSTSSGPLTAIEPPPSKSRHLKPTAAAVAEAKERIARKNEIAARAASATAASRAPSRVDNNPTAHERWTASEIAVETSQAELYKPDGALPVPSSSWDITPHAGDGGLPFAVRFDA